MNQDIEINVLVEQRQFETMLMCREASECSLGVRAIRARAKHLLRDYSALLQISYSSGNTLEYLRAALTRLLTVKVEETTPEWLP